MDDVADVDEHSAVDRGHRLPDLMAETGGMNRARAGGEQWLDVGSPLLPGSRQTLGPLIESQITPFHHQQQLLEERERVTGDPDLDWIVTSDLGHVDVDLDDPRLTDVIDHARPPVACVIVAEARPHGQHEVRLAGCLGSGRGPGTANRA